ncbi:MAG: trypsin-like serine protease [Myxococcales bacterium]|nr:trypsin-like serine protease [Myxococcales bacterium]
MTDPAALQRALDAVVVVQTGSSYCAGAGVGAGPSAYIVTAYHCVADGGRPHLRWRDGRTGHGKVVARSPRDDLALIHVVEELEADRAFSVLQVREDSPVQGEEVWGLGHPFGLQAGGKLSGLLEWSVTHGVVSAVGTHLVQTDAALNPGNSGGPLIDSEGRLIGVVSRKLRADNLAFVSTAANVTALLAQVGDAGPSLGGSVGAGLVLAAEQSTWAGLEGWFSLRDRVVCTGALGFAPGDEWAAHGSVDVAIRQRIGRGALTGLVEVGPALVWDGSAAPVGSWLDGQVDPALVGRVGFNQLMLGAWWHPLPEAGETREQGEPVGRVGITVSLAWPGRIGVF